MSILGTWIEACQGTDIGERRPVTCPGVDVGGVDSLFMLNVAEACPGIHAKGM